MEGESAREEVEGLEKGAKRAEDLATHALENSKAYQDAVNKSADKMGELSDNKNALKQRAKDRFNDTKVGKSLNNATNAVKNSRAAKGVNSAVDTVKNSKPGQMLGKAAGGAKDLALGAGTNAANEAMQMDESKSAGELINKVEEVGKDALKAGAKVATGDVAGAAVIGTKYAVKIAVGAIAIFVGFAFVLWQMMGNLLSSVITHASEAFDATIEAMNPTKVESFTMEDQYELLAVAFGDSVMEAYRSLIDEIDEEIDSYDVDPAYNEWTDILTYNKAISKIKYDTMVLRESEINEASDVGMPQDELGEMVDVYIGGYTGSHTDDEFEENSKTLGRYDKGLYKKDTTVYATGEEPYFDLDRVRDYIHTEAAYAAISDMSYLVAGYSVSMNENPILDMGEKIRTLKYNLTVIEYKIDIQQRVLQQNMGETADLFASHNWFEAGRHFLSFIFNGEETYFKYSPELINQISETASRWVYEYHQGIETNCFDYTFTYEIDYEDEDGNSHSTTVTVDYPRSDDIARVTRTSYKRPTASEFDSTAKGKLPEGAKNATITSRSEDRSNEIWVNRSGYDLTEKFYDQWTLDIPMEAFDVDRMMKALFETSVYWTEIDGYYTDRSATYSYVPGETENYDPYYIDQASGQDEILNYYGKYIAEWKYAYTDKDITYPNGPGTVHYAAGEQYENGIDKQPYFQYDEVYFYNCNCSPNFGVTAFCQKCGTHELIRSNEIGADAEQQGWGDRPVSQMTSPLVSDSAYFRFFDSMLGNSLQELMRDVNQPRKQNLMIVMTTTDKLVLDDYTGEQVGGSLGNDYKGPALQGMGDETPHGEVVLEYTNADGNTGFYYPITVEDRILQLKDSSMNVLENSDYIQNLLAKTGLTYSERLLDGSMDWSDLLQQRLYEYPCNCATENPGKTERCPICGEKGTIVFGAQPVDSTLTADYIKGLIPVNSIDNIEFDSEGNIIVGAYNYSGSQAAKIVNQAITNNPDKFQQLLTANNLTEGEFKSNWALLNKGSYNTSIPKSAVQNVLKGLLAETAAEQENMFNQRIIQITNYLKNQCNITDPGTIALVGSVIAQMPIDDVTAIGHKGELSSFNQQVLIGSISAGTDNSLDTAYNSLVKWTQSGSKYCPSSIASSLEANYNKIAADKESGNLPWIPTGGIVPENLSDMCDYLRSLCDFCKQQGDTAKLYIHYSQGRTSDAYPRMMKGTLMDAIKGYMATGTTPFSSDCSAFVNAVYWQLGYEVPQSSSEWKSGRQYAARTDWNNIQRGDVVVWRSSKGGHCEIYVGPGPQESLGFGSAPPKIHPNWSYYDNAHGASARTFYRVVK